MNVGKITAQIISLPVDFARDGSDKSAIDLLVDSGYLEAPVLISVDVLAEALRQSPELIESWLLWSENKRSDSGWYLLRESPKEFRVGYYPRSAGLPATEYTDVGSACANFIKLEIEDIRKSIPEK